MTWTAEQLESLRGMIARGMSGGQIAAVLGTTRNAVIAKWNRLGIAPGQPRTRMPNPLHAKAARKERKPRRAPTSRQQGPMFRQRAIAAAALNEADLEPASSPDAVAFIARRTEQCAWPLWGDAEPPITERLVCGPPVLAGGCSWCARHALRVWSPRASR